MFRWGPNDYVISADEKTSIQARCRCHPTLGPGVARAMRVNHDYDRGGAVAYLAAYDVHRGKVFGRCEDTTGIQPFGRLVAQVMTQQPYASAERVYWIVDNGSSHRGREAVDRLAEQFPNAVMVHTPVHASWLNQIEIYFSIVQRKALSPNDFTDLDAIQRLPDPLQPDSAAVQMEVHHCRPARTADQARQPSLRAQPDPAPSSLNATPTNLRAGPLTLRAEHCAQRVSVNDSPCSWHSTPSRCLVTVAGMARWGALLHPTLRDRVGHFGRIVG